MFRAPCPVAKHDHAVGPNSGFDQLAQARNPEARGQQLVGHAAAQGGGDADHQVQAVHYAQLGPQLDQVAVVALRLGKLVRVVDPVVVEEHPWDFVTLGERRLGETVGGIRRLMGKRALVHQNSKLHFTAVPAVPVVAACASPHRIFEFYHVT